MKKLTVLMVVVLSVVLWSCGGGAKESPEEKAERRAKAMMEKMGVDAEEFDQMTDKVKEMAENAGKIAEEEAAETEEDKETYSAKNVELLGLTVTERKISAADWEKAKTLGEAYKSLENEQLRELTPEIIEKMIMDAGFDDLESAKGSLTEIADSWDLSQSVVMSIGLLKSTRMLDGDETYKEKMKELGDKINEMGYSAEDMKAMDENTRTSAAIKEILFRLNN